MKRVLIVGMSPIIGGVEMMLINIFRCIDKSKIKFDFLTFCAKCAYEEKLVENGCNVFHITRRGKNPLKSYLELKNFFQRHSCTYNYIWVHLSSASNCTSNVLAKRYTQAKIISHSHGTNFESKNSFFHVIHNIIHCINHKRFMKCTDYYFACSEAAGKWLYGKNFSGQLVIVKNGIQIEKFKFNQNIRKDYRSKWHVDNNLVVCHVGRFNHAKNHDFIIDVFYQLHQQNSNTCLILIGDGDERMNIQNKVHQLELDDAVKFLGFREDIPSLLQAVDVLLLPSLYEGLPLVAIEAQASGVKCFLSDTITREVDITGLVDFISLNKSAKFWAEQISQGKYTYDRNKFQEKISQQGYDISATAGSLEKFFLS